MGSVSAMESINRILKNHARELMAELQDRYPSKLIKRFELENNVYEIAVQAELTDGTTINLAPYDIDELARRFPDCKVGY